MRLGKHRAARYFPPDHQRLLELSYQNAAPDRHSCSYGVRGGNRNAQPGEYSRASGTAMRRPVADRYPLAYGDAVRAVDESPGPGQ